MSSLYVTSGDSYTGTRRLVVTVVDPDGIALDLTGINLTFMVKTLRTDADEDALITKTTPTDIALAAQIDPTVGVAYLTIEEADTADLNGQPGGYAWELEADDPEGKLTLADGRFHVARDLIIGS